MTDRPPTFTPHKPVSFGNSISQVKGWLNGKSLKNQGREPSPEGEEGCLAAFDLLVVFSSLVLFCFAFPGTIPSSRSCPAARLYQLRVRSPGLRF